MVPFLPFHQFPPSHPWVSQAHLVLEVWCRKPWSLNDRHTGDDGGGIFTYGKCMALCFVFGPWIVMFVYIFRTWAVFVASKACFCFWKLLFKFEPHPRVTFEYNSNEKSKKLAWHQIKLHNLVAKSEKISEEIFEAGRHQRRVFHADMFFFFLRFSNFVCYIVAFTEWIQIL